MRSTIPGVHCFFWPVTEHDCPYALAGKITIALTQVPVCLGAIGQLDVPDRKSSGSPSLNLLRKLCVERLRCVQRLFPIKHGGDSGTTFPEAFAEFGITQQSLKRRS